MNALPPDHPPIKAARPDLHHHAFWRDAGRWIGAGIFVLTVHAAGAYAIHMAQQAAPPDGAEVAAMVVELAPEPMAPVEEQVSEQVQPETAEAPQEAAPEEPVPPEPEEVTPPEPEPAPEPTPEPEQKVEEVVPDAVEAEKPDVAVPLPAEKPEPKSEPKPEPKPAPKPEPKAEKKPEPKKAEKPKVQKPKKAEKAPETRRASAPRMDADSGPKAAANRRGENNASAGVSSAKWQSKVQSHMARNVRFLQRRARNAKGLVQVTFVIDPSGNVLSARLAGSSGDAAVDQLALEAARRASPVPAPPPALAKARMPITLPLLFK